MRLLKEFLADESGPTVVEYAVMLALILLVCFLAITFFGQQARALWDENGKIADAMK